MFRHGVGNTPAYHGSGFVSGMQAVTAGLMQAAVVPPSPQDAEETMGLMSEPGAWMTRINRQLATPALMADPQEDMILFCEAEQRDAVHSRNGEEWRRYTQFNAIALNWVLGAIEVSNARGGRGYNLDTAEAVLERYAFDGVVATEEGKEDAQHPHEHAGERVFNMRIRGPENTFNVFGDDIGLGTSAFVVVRKLDITGETFRPRIMSNEPAMTLPGMPGGRKLFAWQVSFYANKMHKTPPMSELEYVDENGVKRYGAYRRIGIIGNAVPSDTRTRRLQSVPRDYPNIASQPKVKFLISQAG